MSRRKEKTTGYIAWGHKARPRALFPVPGGVDLIYNSKPPEGWEEGARNQTGSLAFSRNLVDWHDYPFNPILTVETTARISSLLFRHGGYWAIAYTHSYFDEDGKPDTDRMSMRMAIAGIHPKLLRVLE